MIRRHVLAALATGVEAGSDDAARAALANTEWPLRGSARRELERALVDAALISRALISDANVDEMRHVQRVAALSLTGHYEVDATQRDAVTDAYEKLPAPKPAAPIATIALVLGALALVGLIAWAVIAMHRPHRHTRAAAPPVWGAFATGGTPATDRAIEHLLTDELPDFVIETDTDRHSDDHVRAAHAAELRNAPAITPHGPALTHAWQELIDALDHWADAPVHSRGYRDAEARLRAAAQGVSDQFAALGLGYHLEANVVTTGSAAHGTVFAFRVEDVVYVRAGGEPRRVLSLRRMDRINVEHAVLGMQTEELGDPVVLLDQIEGFVQRRLSSVVFEASFMVGDETYAHTNQGDQLGTAAGTAIARELAPMNRNLAAITRAVVATVRRHEARHGYDNDREPMRSPAALDVLIGTDKSVFVQRARAELSGYLSQIASDPTTPQLALWNMASLGFSKWAAGTAESYVAVVVVTGLARQLGVPAVAAVVHDGHIDRGRLAELALPLARASDDALRAAARRLWQELYGEPLVAIVDPDATLSL